MADIQQRLESIRVILTSFKHEQEQIILRSNDDYKFRPSNKMNKIIPIPMNGSGSDDMTALTKIINLDSVIMPMGSETQINQKLWPQALVANYREYKGVMGNIESHGSLWKLLPRKDNFPGFRVYLQSTEMGEEIKYLSNTLELVDSKVDAALWNLRISDPPIDPNMTSVPVDQSNTTKGIPVIFELFEPTTSSNDHNPNATSTNTNNTSSNNNNTSNTTNKPTDPLLLVCSSSTLSSLSQLEILSLSTIRSEQKKDQLKVFSFIWEVCPDGWINEDLDFLDKYLN